LILGGGGVGKKKFQKRQKCLLRGKKKKKKKKNKKHKKHKTHNNNNNNNNNTEHKDGSLFVPSFFALLCFALLCWVELFNEVLLGFHHCGS
jgi:hypothetical protein